MNVSAVSVLAGAALWGYLCGSIPFGLVFTRWSGIGDIRAIGSGNIGATNVLRTGRKGLAAATLLCDALKGTLAVALASSFGETAALAAGLSAFLGHIFPIWLKFKGGKGVATFLGVVAALDWRLAVLFMAIWLGTAGIARYSSLAALVASALTPMAAYLLGERALAAALAVMTMILWWTHRQNISRLRLGVESRIGRKGQAGDGSGS